MEMRNGNIVQGWMALAGIVLVAVGLLGFVSNPLVGSDPNAFLRTNTLHNIVHLATGLIALYIAFGLRGEAQANGAIGFGVLYVVIFLALIVSPELFGLFADAPARPNEHVIHGALAIVSLAVGYMARNRSARTTNAY
jgi:hypothetical protein